MDKKNIMPFHLFTHHGNSYVINTEGMQAMAVDEIAADALEKIKTQPKTPITQIAEKALEKLGLISNSSGISKKTIRKEPIPITNMTIFLTQSCNLKCIYCYGDSGTYSTGGSMEEKTAYRAVDWLIEQSGKMKKIHIEFLGGEPFLRFNLMKAVVAYAKKRTLEVGKMVDFHCTTNATLLEDEQISFIKEYSISITISFDGPREIQDTQRPYANGKGTFDSTLPNIKKVLSVLPGTPVHAIIVGNTDPKLIKDSLKEIGFTDISIAPASNSLSAIDTASITSKRNTRYFIQELEQEAEAWISLIQDKDGEALKNLKTRSGLYDGLVSLLHNRKKYYTCGAGRGLVAVSASGDVYLCQRFVGRDEYKLGSVFNKYLNRKEYQNSPTKSNRKCSLCFARYYCAGGCKHDNLGSTGSISVPSEDVCRLRCRELELAASIVCRLKLEDLDYVFEQEILPPKTCLFDL